jgi:2-dehydro-3-deoxygluconokinase
VSSTSAPLVTLGEVLAVLRADAAGPLDRGQTMRLSIAGSESNVAIGVSRLGGRATFIGRTGADSLGAMVHASLRGAGVRARLVKDADRSTGLMLVERRLHDVRRVQYYRLGSAGGALRPDDLGPNAVRGAGLLHVTGITPVLSETAAATVTAAIAEASAYDVPVSVDLNYRAALASPERYRSAIGPVLEKAQLAFASLDEVRLVLEAPDGDGPEELVAALARRGPAEVVLTDGRRGAWASVDGREYRQDAVPVTATDPVGAGDAFVAGYLAARLAGRPVAHRLTQAAAVAAVCVASEGDWEGLPYADEFSLLGLDDGAVHR